jgi:phosphoglycerate kinase
MSHLGRPGGKPDPDLSLSCVAAHLEELLDERVRFSSNTTGAAVKEVINNMPEGSVMLLENTRFEPGEKKNDDVFAAELAELADVYVNDAFGAAHRAHASTEGVARQMPKAAMGLLMEREVEVLTKVRDHPEQPLVVLLGGAKVSDKIGVIEAFSETAEHVLVGGAMSYTFLKALGHEVGDSRVEEDRLDRAEELYDNAPDTIQLPSDHVIADEFSADAETQTVEGDIPDGWMGLDIGPATIDAYRAALNSAATIIWNGPMGVFEMEPFATGTRAMAETLADATDGGAYTVVGGGDSVAALAEAGYTDRISHVSTGGGAMLTFLEGEPLPGLEALTDAS